MTAQTQTQTQSRRYSPSVQVAMQILVQYPDKLTPADVSVNMAQAAKLYCLEQSGPNTLSFVASIASQVRKGYRLSEAQIAGVLNCMRAEAKMNRGDYRKPATVKVNPIVLNAYRVSGSTPQDQLRNAQAYGRRTGRCQVCRRRLTDPKSVSEGIGPVCASRILKGQVRARTI